MTTITINGVNLTGEQVEAVNRSIHFFNANLISVESLIGCDVFPNVDTDITLIAGVVDLIARSQHH